MQEFLFRGKSKGNKDLQDGEWVVGSAISDPENASYCIGSMMRVWGIDPETIGPFTGMKDKNGKMIFQGDIVKTKYGRLCLVVWFIKRAMFDLDPIQSASNAKTKAPDDFDLWWSENLEVVGNAFDGW